MSELSAREQLFLELVNRARMDPAGEAKRFGVSVNSGLASGTISTAPKQVLASNAFLASSADAHSQWMLDTDKFSHTGVNGSDHHDRMTDAGYVFSGNWMSGENIAWTGNTASIDANASIFTHHRNLFLSPGHRENIMKDEFREIGIGSLTGQFVNQGTAYNGLMTTQNFAKSGSDRFVTGVHYGDDDNDNFYSIGEGQSGRSAQLFQNGVAVASTTSLSAGGYNLKTNVTGSVEVVFSGGGLAEENGAAFALTGLNVKVDLVDNNTIESNVSITLTRGSDNASLLGQSKASLVGNSDNNTLIGNTAANIFYGLDGDDVIIGRSGKDRIIGGAGHDRLTGGADVDRFIYTSPGDGGDVIVNFKTNDFFVFRSAGFDNHAKGKLPSSEFVARANNLAQDSNDHFIFRTTDDTLWHDSNGSAAGGLTLIADLNNDVKLTAGDILIV